MERNLIKTPDYIVHGFRPDFDILDIGHVACRMKGHIKRSRMAQLKSFVAPSSEELWGWREI